MSTKKEEIVGTMTIKEAAANWEDPRRQHLKRWGETFGVPLQELHPGHVVTYQNDRGDETTAAQVDAEVSALLALLKQIGLGGEIERRNRLLGDAGEITAAEFKALPETTRKYILRSSDRKYTTYRQEMTEWRIEFGEQIGAGAVSEKCSTQHGKEEGG